jgi:type IV secretory pathway VirB10-like protein
MNAPVSPQPDVLVRAKPPSPKRLSRKMLLSGAGLAAIVVAFALISGLSERPERRTAVKTETTAAGGPPESVRQAPSEYDFSRLPQNANDPSADIYPVVDQTNLLPPADPVWTGGRAPDGGATASSGRGYGASRAAQPDARELARLSPILFGEKAMQARSGKSDQDRLETRLSAPRSPYELQAGQVIPAALVTALNSDLPGRVVAQVSAPVYDSVTGETLLIPQGARLIGAYSNGVRYGDRRIMLVWNRLILPDGWSLNLQNMDATDSAGTSGLSDYTDNHWGRLAGAVALSSIISVAANETEDNGRDSSFSQSLGDAAAQQAAQTGSRIVDRELSVRPTLKVRAGAPVRVLVSRDIQLRPYQIGEAP